MARYLKCRSCQQLFPLDEEDHDERQCEVDTWVKEQVAKAPPLSEDQKRQLAALLRGTTLGDEIVRRHSGRARKKKKPPPA